MVDTPLNRGDELTQDGLLAYIERITDELTAEEIELPAEYLEEVQSVPTALELRLLAREHEFNLRNVGFPTQADKASLTTYFPEFASQVDMDRSRFDVFVSAYSKDEGRHSNVSFQLLQQVLYDVVKREVQDDFREDQDQFVRDYIENHPTQSHISAYIKVVDRSQPDRVITKEEVPRLIPKRKLDAIAAMSTATLNNAGSIDFNPTTIAHGQYAVTLSTFRERIIEHTQRVNEHAEAHGVPQVEKPDGTMGWDNNVLYAGPHSHKLSQIEPSHYHHMVDHAEGNGQYTAVKAAMGVVPEIFIEKEVNNRIRSLIGKLDGKAYLMVRGNFIGKDGSQMQAPEPVTTEYGYDFIRGLTVDEDGLLHPIPTTIADSQYTDAQIWDLLHEARSASLARLHTQIINIGCADDVTKADITRLRNQIAFQVKLDLSENAPISQTVRDAADKAERVHAFWTNTGSPSIPETIYQYVKSDGKLPREMVVPRIDGAGHLEVGLMRIFYPAIAEDYFPDTVHLQRGEAPRFRQSEYALMRSAHEHIEASYAPLQQDAKRAAHQPPLKAREKEGLMNKLRACAGYVRNCFASFGGKAMKQQYMDDCIGLETRLDEAENLTREAAQRGKTVVQRAAKRRQRPGRGMRMPKPGQY